MSAIQHRETARQVSTVDTCKLIRLDLKAFFPGVKFSVTTKHYGSIDIHWTDGPTQATVDAVTKFYQCASFDGMTDSTSYYDRYIKGERVHFCANFVMAQRAISVDFIKAMTPIVCKKYGQPEPVISIDKWGNAELSQYDPNWRCGHDTLRDLIFQACHTTDSRHVEPISSPASKFRELATGLQKRIDDKRKPHDWNLTARRANMEQRQEIDARNLEKLQSKLIALADLWDNGYVSERIARVATMGVVELLMRGHMPDAQTQPDDFKRLIAAGLGNDRAFQNAALEISLLGDQEVGKPTAADTLRDLETKVRLSKIAGFFPTPNALVEKMIDAADLREGMTVLEPSAGKGDIAERLPNFVQVETIERNFDLRHILEIKGLGLIADCYDFLEFSSKRYDRIMMNPPFEALADIDHVMHAYDLLKSGGRIVAIMSESPFFRETAKAVEFRAWLETVGTSEKLAPETFKDSDVPTSVNTRLVIIDKPAEKETPLTESTTLAANEIDYDWRSDNNTYPFDTIIHAVSQTAEQKIDQKIADWIDLSRRALTMPDKWLVDKKQTAREMLETLCMAEGLTLSLLYLDYERHVVMHNTYMRLIRELKAVCWAYLK